MRSRPLRASRNKSRPLDNVAVTLTEQHFDRASECRAEIFPAAARTSAGTWRTRPSSRCDFVWRSCRHEVSTDMSLIFAACHEPPKTQGLFIYVIIPVLAAALTLPRCTGFFFSNTCKKDPKNPIKCLIAVPIIRFDVCARPRWKVDCLKLTGHSASDLRCLSSPAIPRTGASLAVAPRVIDGPSPTHLFRSRHSGRLFLPQPTCASAREQRHACRCSVTEHESSSGLIHSYAPLALPRVDIPRCAPAAGSLDRSLGRSRCRAASRPELALAGVF